jgi:hypothetical protein
MSKAATLSKRLVRVITVQQEQAVHRFLTETARDLNVEPARLLAEYERIIQRCQAEGAVTKAERIVIVADELGMSVADLTHDLAVMEAQLATARRASGSTPDGLRRRKS